MDPVASEAWCSWSPDGMKERKGEVLSSRDAHDEAEVEAFDTIDLKLPLTFRSEALAHGTYALNDLESVTAGFRVSDERATQEGFNKASLFYLGAEDATQDHFLRYTTNWNSTRKSLHATDDSVRLTEQ